MVDILVEDLTEMQALRLEAELIAAFGTIECGGLLTNAVVPSGLGGKKRQNIVVPQGCIERAQLGIQFLKNAIFELAKANPEGITNADAASLLGLRSDSQGGQKDYLSYSVIGFCYFVKTKLFVNQKRASTWQISNKTFFSVIA